MGLPCTLRMPTSTVDGSRPAFTMNPLAEMSASYRATLRAELEALLYPPQRTEPGR